MAKSKPVSNKLIDDSSSAFPVPFSLKEFQGDILEVFYFHLRTICWIVGDKAALRIVDGVLAPDSSAWELHDPDSTASDIGLTYDHIRETTFATSLEHLYQFAYYGRVDASAGPMEDESEYSWIAAIVKDACHGAVNSEWGLRNYEMSKHSYNCLAVVDLSNARVVLEGGEPFTIWGRHEMSDAGEWMLTIHQMAILSGMEEMSIRAAANPKRANPLITISEHGSTRVDPEVAKAWLKSKGKYIPIVRQWVKPEIDLTTKPFANVVDLVNALDARCNAIETNGNKELLNGKLQELGLKLGRTFAGDPMLEVSESQFADDVLMRRLAAAIELPPELFSLRVKQVLAQQQLSRIEKQLREFTEAQTATAP